MNRKARLVVVAAAVLLIVAGGWYWWHARRVELYGGIKPFMQKMATLHRNTIAELNKNQPLPEDFTDMEQLAQVAQDILPVFAKDPRYSDPRFGSLATGFMRRASILEHAWDYGTRKEAVSAFGGVTAACNECHRQYGGGQVPALGKPG